MAVKAVFRLPDIEADKKQLLADAKKFQEEHQFPSAYDEADILEMDDLVKTLEAEETASFENLGHLAKLLEKLNAK
jgi:hypothetical protein